MSLNPTWLTDLEATAQEMLLDGPDRELYDKEFKPEVVLALCKLVRELGEALKKYEHVPAPDLRNSVTQFSAAADALERFKLGPVTGEESGER